MTPTAIISLTHQAGVRHSVLSWCPSTRKPSSASSVNWCWIRGKKYLIDFDIVAKFWCYYRCTIVNTSNDNTYISQQVTQYKFLSYNFSLAQSWIGLRRDDTECPDYCSLEVPLPSCWTWDDDTESPTDDEWTTYWDIREPCTSQCMGFDGTSATNAHCDSESGFICEIRKHAVSQ